MYPEFIVIYVCLAIIIGLLIAILCITIKNKSSAPVKTRSFTPMEPATSNMGINQPASSVVVFCKKCATQYDSSQAYCPHCGTPR